MSGRPSRWHGPELDALRLAYETTALMVVDIAGDFHTSPGHVCRLVKRHGWKRRGYERLPDAVRQHWKWYRKLKAEYGRAAAIKEIAKAAALMSPMSPAAAPATGEYVPVVGSSIDGAST